MMSNSVNIICAVCAFAFGTLAAYINLLISRRGAKSDSVAGVMGNNAARMLVDAATLGIVYFVCRRFELPLGVCLIAAATGLAVCGMLMLRSLIKKLEEKNGGE